MSIKIMFYEGSYQYNVVMAQMPEKTSPVHGPESNLYAGVLDELNHQFNYRPTKQDLWAIVESEGKELCRVVREQSSKATIKIFDGLKLNSFGFVPLEKYSLIFINQ